MPPGAPPAPPPPVRRQERPRRPRPDGGGGRLLCAPYPLLHPAPLPEQPGGPDTGAGDPGLYGPALPRSPGAARAGVLSHRLAGGGAAGQLGTFTIHAPSGEEDVRPVSFQGADGARSCWQLPAAQVRALDGLRGAQLDYEEAQAEQIRAAIQAPQAWVCGQVRRSDPAFAREMERLFQRDFQDSSLWLSEWLAYQSQGTLDQWYDLERARALSLTGRDGAVFRFSLIPYHENAYQVLALAGEDGQVVRLLALLPNDTLEELDLLLASPDA